MLIAMPGQGPPTARHATDTGASASAGSATVINVATPRALMKFATLPPSREIAIRTENAKGRMNVLIRRQGPEHPKPWCGTRVASWCVILSGLVGAIMEIGAISRTTHPAADIPWSAPSTPCLWQFIKPARDPLHPAPNQQPRFVLVIRLQEVTSLAGPP
jgi:hypothetical protein